MAGNPGNAAMSPPCGREKSRHPSHALIKQCLDRRFPTFDTPMLKANTGNIKSTCTSTPCGPRTYKILARAQILTPLTAKARLRPLVD